MFSGAGTGVNESNYQQMATTNAFRIERVSHYLTAASILVGKDGTNNPTFAGYLANINSAQTRVNAALAGLNAKSQAVTGQILTIRIAERELYAQTSSSSEQIAQQAAAVRSAQASVASAYAGLAKSSIWSSLNGIVSRVDIKLGEVATAYQPVIALMSDAKFQVEVGVPEVEIAKLKPENPASIALDAYGTEVFPARVVQIDPAAVAKDGVPTYKVTLEFTTNDERIRSGMTADIKIVTDTRQGVLAVPQAAIRSKGGKAIVLRRMGDRRTSEVPVEVGLISGDGRQEILSGLSEGDEVVIS
jgi:HlyD family secretion protein